MRSFKIERNHRFHRFSSFFVSKSEGTRTVILDSVVKHIPGRVVQLSRVTASDLPHTMHERLFLIAGPAFKGAGALVRAFIFSINQSDFT
jgi:hypothetical protein